jgi:hypothetical protein
MHSRVCVPTVPAPPRSPVCGEFACACNSQLQASCTSTRSDNRATCTTPSLKSTSSLHSMCVHGHDHCETWQVSTLLVGQPRAQGTHDEVKMSLAMQLALDLELILQLIDSMNKHADVHVSNAPVHVLCDACTPPTQYAKRLLLARAVLLNCRPRQRRACSALANTQHAPHAGQSFLPANIE